jgi:hypothetical protein
MPRNQYTRLRGLANNKKTLLNFIGYNSIRGFRSDNAGYNSNDAAYRDILDFYNQQIDQLNQQAEQNRRQVQTQLRQQTTNRNRYIKTITNQVNRIEASNNTTDTSIPIDLDQLDNIKYLLAKLRPQNRRYYFMSGQRIYMLNAATIRRLEDLLNNRVTTITTEYESGREIIVAIEESRDLSLHILPRVTGNGLVEGGLFPYNHNLDNLDIKRYAIYHKNTKWGDELNDNNCFITSLKCAGIDTTKAEEYIKNQFIPIRYLKDIALKLNIYITLKTLGGKKVIRKYGNPEHKLIPLGLIEKHYFLIEPTNFTSFSIRNYFREIKGNKLGDLNRWNEITEIEKDGKIKRKSTYPRLDSYDLIKLLIDLKTTHLSVFVGVEIYKMNNFKKYEEDIFTSLEYNDSIYEKRYNPETHRVEEINPDGELTRNEAIKENTKKIIASVIYFDFETTTKRNDKLVVNHTPYCCFTNQNDIGYWGENCGKQLLDDLCKRYGFIPSEEPDEREYEVLVLIAHNSGYDFRFILKYLNNVETIEKGNGLMWATCDYWNYGKRIKIEVRDSLKMINMPLKKFGDAFKLKVKKEIMPYDLYTEENIVSGFIDKDECLSFVKEEEHPEYLKNCKEWDCIVDNKINILRYAGKYCYMDCITLKAGYEKFQYLCKKAIYLDPLNYVSLASMANDYLVRQGCYEGVLKMCGIPRAFIQKCIVGGRTMCAENKKHHIKDKLLADFDAVSLYPSGMARMTGFLKGKPKIITNFEPDKYDGYFICIRIKKVNKRLQFPLCSYVDEKGVRIFTNDLEGRIIYIDKIGLEDFIHYQEAEYEFINGYYYDQGHNPQIKETIQYLFTQRLKYKKEDNPLQLVFKECMNSSYGKSYMKPIESDIEYIKTEDFVTFVNRHFNYIKQATLLANGKKYKIVLMKPVNKHYNNAHIGVEILSITKRIMNEVMCLAEELKLSIYYQDTDSIHIDDKDIQTLAEEYKNIHNKELIGKGMGQFHTDFNMEKAKGEIYAVESIFLGKKCYVDKLKSVDAEGKDIYDYHIRMKGVPEDSILYKAETEYGGDIIKMYKELYDGKEIIYNLLAVRPKFDMKKDMTIQSKVKFDRAISFVSDEIKLQRKKDKKLLLKK